MVPVVAIVGRPNVGKSTLFNALTRTRDALVVDLPGTTRDRQYGAGKVGAHPYILIDTGGMAGLHDDLDRAVTEQSWRAIAEADVIIFLVDAHVGVTNSDVEIAKQLRKLSRQPNKHVHLVVNKTDGHDIDLIASDFFSLGLGAPIPISASNRRGLARLTTAFLQDFMLPEVLATDSAPVSDQPNPIAQYFGIKVAIVGQPNVGKSTLINRILGEERVVVSALSGTTRDCIFVPFKRDGQEYTLIDTAGIRRKGKINESIEKFSVVKTLKAIEECNVAVLVIDATRGVTEQDLHLLDFIVTAGRALVIAVNKWDGLSAEDKDAVKKPLGYRLQFVDFAIQHFISALHGSGVGNIFASIQQAYKSAMRDLSTPELTRLLEEIVTAHQPPLVQGRRIKLRYAHSGGNNPPRIIIHGNQTDHVPDSYKRYMINAFITRLKLKGTPLILQFKTSDNPYKDKRNILTPRQLHKRDRIRKIARRSEGKK